MPLIKSKSKKAFEYNIKEEMRAHPEDKKRDLAIAYSVQRKAKSKKMADGGEVKPPMNKEMSSEKGVHLPRGESPNRRGTSKMGIHEGMGAKNEALRVLNESRQMKPKLQGLAEGGPVQGQNGWTDNPTVSQSQRPSKTSLSRPKIVKGGTFSSMDADLARQEEMLQSKMPPSSDKDQPESEYNEEGPDRQGPKLSDMEHEHNNHRKPYFEGGTVSQKDSEYDGVEHPAGLEEDDDQMSPAHDEYMGGKEPMLAEGGMLESEEEIEHHDSLAAAIMAKRKMMSQDSDSDEDHMVKMAEGGQVGIDENAEEQPNGYYGRNEHAALKENYDSDMDDVSEPTDSNEMGDSREMSEENEHDMISHIRSKMKSRKQF